MGDISRLEGLPLETICNILEGLNVEDLARVMAVNKWLREAVQKCSTTLELGKAVAPASLLRRLPLITRVNGFIKIKNEEDLVYVSQRFRGPLSVVGGDWNRHDMGHRGEFNPQSIYLESLLARASLYPSSPFRAYNQVRDTNAKGEKIDSVLQIEWNPASRALVLHLMYPGSPMGGIMGTFTELNIIGSLMGGIMGTFARLDVLGSLFHAIDPIALDLSLRSSGPHSIIRLEPLVVESIGDIEILYIDSRNLDILADYIRFRQEDGIPIVLREIHITGDIGEEWGGPLPLLRTLGNIQPVPSVTTLDGVIGAVESRHLLYLFPNLKEIFAEPQDVYSLRTGNFGTTHPHVTITAYQPASHSS